MNCYRIRAESVIHPGNLLLEESSGACFIYFAEAEKLSATSLSPSLADAMIQSYEWEAVEDDIWLTLDEIQLRGAPQVPPTSGDSGMSQANTPS